MKFGRCAPDAENLTAEHALGVYGRRFSIDQTDAVLARLESERLVDIARSMVVPDRWITDLVYRRRQRGQMVVPKSEPKDDFLLASDMWAAGAKIREIAAAYGYTLKRMCGVIEHYRRKFGWFPRRNRRRS